MRIVVVDDEPIICEGLAMMLEIQTDKHWDLFATYHDAEEALESCNWEQVDVLLLDISMPGMNGLEMVQMLRDRDLNTLVIIISGYAQFEYAREAMRHSAVDFITKPVATEKLFEALSSAEKIIESRKLERKKQLLIKENIERLIREYFNEIIFGTQKFSDSQIEDFSLELNLQDKSYIISIILKDEGAENCAKLLEEANNAFSGSFYIYPAGSGLIVVLGILANMNSFNSSLLLQYAKRNIEGIKWFGSAAAQTISDINQIYAELFQRMRDSGAIKLVRRKVDIKQVNLLPKESTDYSLPVLQVLEIIENNYVQPLSLSFLASKIFVHPVYLSNLFKRQVGLSLIEYINRYRIEQAKKLLEDPLNKIFWISEQVGFMNQRYFSQVFKRITGQTPVEYRSNSFLTSADD